MQDGAPHSNDNLQLGKTSRFRYLSQHLGTRQSLSRILYQSEQTLNLFARTFPRTTIAFSGAEVAGQCKLNRIRNRFAHAFCHQYPAGKGQGIESLRLRNLSRACQVRDSAYSISFHRK